MARTSLVHLSFTLSLLVHLILPSACSDTNSTKSKRQIFREQVNPQAGGRIPEDAFRSDRLALNRLNKEGIAVPDGVVLEARHRESHYGSYRLDPDIQASIVKVVLGEDGRYAPPEGRYPFNSLVESTYVLRPPINTPVIAVPPRRPYLSTLRLPARPFFQQDGTVNSLDQQIEYFNSFDPNYAGTGLWTGLLGPVPDVPNRLLRRQAKIPVEDIVAQNSNVAAKVSASPPSRGRALEWDHIDYNHQASPRPQHEGRGHLNTRNNYRYTRPTFGSFSSSSESSDKSKDDYENSLVPVYLTPHGNLHKNSNYISYIPPETKYNYHNVLPVVNAPFSTTPNYFYQIQPTVSSISTPLDKTVQSRPHYVLDPPPKEIYNSHSEKTLYSSDHKNKLKAEEEDQFQSVVQNPQVSSALFDEKKKYNQKFQEVTKQHYQEYANLEDSFPKLPSSSRPDQHPHSLKQNNILVPVQLTHNLPTSQEYNFIKHETPQEPEVDSREETNNQDSHYQFINGYGNFDSDYRDYKPAYQQSYNHPPSFNDFPEDNNEAVKDEHSNFKHTENVQEQHTVHRQHAVQHPSPPTPFPKQDHALNPPANHQEERWQRPTGNNLQIVNQGNQQHLPENKGVQFVRGGLHFEVVRDASVEQQSRGEVGQKKVRLHGQGGTNFRDTTPADIGSKHLNQVLHYIEPHEVVQQISTAPSIENVYPSLETVPETSFVCRGPGRTMLPDPETSCQVFHLCGAEGSKESFLCPKGARYDAHKQQCAPWTEVTCRA